MRIFSRSPAGRRAARLLSALPAALWCAAAWAQPGSTGSSAAQQDDDVPRPPPGVEEIQIIGERRDNSVQTEAIAVTSFDQNALDEFGVQDVEGLQDFVPSLHIGRVGNQAVITVRGVGLENISVTGRPGVIFEIDGVPLLRPSAALSAAFFDLEDLNVTRGPQGTQGGAQSTGGKIALRSARPKPDFEMGGDFQYGTRHQRLSRGFVNIPIFGEQLMSRFAIYHEDRWGYQRGEYILTEEQRQLALARPLYNPLAPAAGSLNPGIRRKILQSGAYDLSKRKAWGDDAKDLALRGQLMSVLAQDLELRLLATYSSQGGVGPSPVFLEGGESFPVCPETGPGQVCPPELLGFFPPGEAARTITAIDPRVNVSNEQQFRDNFQVGVTPSLKWDIPVPLPALGDARVALVGSWQKNVNRFLLDLDASNAAFTNILVRSQALQRSVELSFSSVEAEDLEWRGGLFYLQESNGGFTLVDVPFASGSGGTGGQVSGGSSVNLNNRVVTKNHSAYGELDFWLTDEIKFTGGVRYTRETLSAEEFNTTSPDTPTYLASGWEDLTPRGEVLWQFSDTSNLSFGVTKGFKPGGFVLGAGSLTLIRNACGTVPQEQFNQCAREVVGFDAERVYQYQLTNKNQLFDETLTLNLVAFWTAYSSYQSCQVRADAFECVGGGKSQLRGIEVETLWRPDQVPGLAVNMNFNFLKTKIERFEIKDPTETGNNRLFFRDLRGNALPRSPLFKVNAGIAYDVDFGRYGVVTPRVQYNWEDKTYFRTLNRELDLQRAFHMADARLIWRSEDARYTLEAFVENITDEDVLNNVITGPLIAGVPVLGFYRPPRTFGVKFGWNWQ